MNPASLVYGLVRPAGADRHAAVAAKHRDLTLSWSRYDYRGPIIEDASVDRILDRAHALGYRYCFVQFAGHIISEDGRSASASPGFVETLESWARAHEFAWAGSITGAGSGWYGFEPRGLLVDLEQHRRLGAPAFDRTSRTSVELPRPVVERRSAVVIGLRPSGTSQTVVPRRLGWHAIAASLAHGVPVLSLHDVVGARSVSLGGTSKAQTAFRRYLGTKIASYRTKHPDPGLSADQRRFLRAIRLQTARARRGVFLLNVEPYLDVTVRPEGFRPPVSSLYSVAAGFKPNMILHTHGFDEHTRVVFFDYSRTALAIRKYLVEHWDGRNFPAVVDELARRHPPPRTLYQGWAGLPQGELSGRMRAAWAGELSAWGGAEAFRRHWQRYRRLMHEFVHCDILDAPAALLNRVRREPGGVIWWSNAFFTMYANWYRDVAQRRARYETWMSSLAARSPELSLYGADYANISVNAIDARGYWAQYLSSGGDDLRPFHVTRVQIRT